MKIEELNWTAARDILRVHREANVRKSSKIVAIWETVLKQNVSNLGDEQYVVLEQVYIASLDCNRTDIANECLQALTRKFPDSYRVRLLQELMLEALERYDEALEMLDSVIEEDETNPSPRKRKIAILKAKGRVVDAIKELNDYLKKFTVDQDAWNELCTLYLYEQDYGKAGFCMEELILLSPHNHLYHQRFAEIKYTQGGYDNLELALYYFSHALKLCYSNMRALYGLFLSAKQISTCKINTAKKQQITQIINWSLKQIEERYKEAATKKYDVEDLEDTFGTLCVVTDSD